MVSTGAPPAAEFNAIRSGDHDVQGSASINCHVCHLIVRSMRRWKKDKHAFMLPFKVIDYVVIKKILSVQANLGF